MSALVCTDCQREYDLAKPIWRCECGGLLDIAFDAVLDRERIDRRGPTMWRYRDAIPILDDEAIVSFGEGCTPLQGLPVGETRLWVKADYVFPTGSFKDRGASVLISKALELGVRRAVEDSSGNAGAAIAAYCALAGIECHIYVPERAMRIKLAQIEAYGAHIHKVPGTREDAARAAMDAAGACYYASHAQNPFFLHGTKTCAYEICDQFDGHAPGTMVVPVGNGTLLLGLYIGFQDLMRAGVTDRMPMLVAVQEDDCSPLYHAFVNNTEEIRDFHWFRTIADGITIAKPARARQILRAVRETGGKIIIVDDEKIREAMRILCERGHYVEPTGAVGFAGALDWIANGRVDEPIVTVLTGHGLKAADRIQGMLRRMKAWD